MAPDFVPDTTERDNIAAKPGPGDNAKSVIPMEKAKSDVISIYI